jgi:hypothetical protein
MNRLILAFSILALFPGRTGRSGRAATALDRPGSSGTASCPSWPGATRRSKPDPRGAGDSERSAAGYDKRTMAEDIRRQG